MRFFSGFAHYIGVIHEVRLAALVAGAVFGASASSDGDSTAIVAAAASDPLILQVQVVEGDGMIYAPGTRAVKGITVRVTDEVGRPVSAAAVGFRLPDDGATGVFQNNSKSEIAATSADGRASVWGMRWGKVAGAVTIRITAAKGATRAGTLATQMISTDSTAVGGQMISANPKAGTVRMGGGGKKWMWFGLAAGAAGGGLAAYEMTKNGSSSSAAAATAVNTSISTPQITIGPR